MSRPSLCYVDSTILVALVGSGPTSDAVRRWFVQSHDAWVSSEMALTRALQILESNQRKGEPQGLSLPAVLMAFHTGVAIRSLPLGPLRHQPTHPWLSILDALELEAARIWRCPCLISHSPRLLEAARVAGLTSLSIGAKQPATVGDWPRRSPIPP